MTSADTIPGPASRASALDDVETAAAEPIEVRGGGTIRIGTASWTDPTMIAAGVFYPAGADTAEERLHYYAETFPVVEVDATYYALPAPRGPPSCGSTGRRPTSRSTSRPTR